ncbi:MAG: hypothetical protein H7222_01785 [Methylotenera sp.]|nr:hypothetical protein [Oligoflexia bacterium]
MMLWALSFILVGLGLSFLFSDLLKLPGIQAEAFRLQKVIHVFHEFEETLEAGLVPTSETWTELKNLVNPWGSLAHQSLQDLRSKGGSLLPTLRRLRALAETHARGLKDARAKSSQALAQAMVCGGLVPIFGSFLYLLLPGVGSRPWVWILACGGAMILGVFAALWLMKMAEDARWGGLKPEKRSWVLASQCAGEKFLALVRTGVPGDLAWTQSLECLDARLSAEWGHSVWEHSKDSSHSNSSSSSTESVILHAGNSIRKAIQVSLMEGRPCTERVESALLALREDIAAQILRELALLATRALQPLFCCVAPALLGLLGFGLYLGWLEALRN